MSHILRKRTDSNVIKIERESLPEIMKPRAWRNKSTSIHYFESYLEQIDLGLHIEFIRHFPKVIVVKPNQVQVLPHSCFTGHTRDGSPLTGEWCRGEVVEGGLRTEGYGS